MWESNRQKGFTLLEVMISILILSFIMIGVLSITENSQNAKDRTVEINKSNLQIDMALNRLEWDFSQIYSPLYFSQVYQSNFSQNAGNRAIDQFAYKFTHPRFKGISQNGLPIPKFILNDRNNLTFFTTSNRRKLVDTKQSNFMWINYQVIDTPSFPGDDESEIERPKKSLVRYLMPDNIFEERRIEDSIESGDIKASILLNGIDKIEFFFWNRKTQKWVERLTSVEQGESMIRGLKIVIKWIDSTGLERNISKIYRSYWPLEFPIDQVATTNSNNQGATNQNSSNQNSNTTSTGSGQ